MSKKESTGYIRGKKVVGSANAYRCYSKDIATKLIIETNDIVNIVLRENREFLLNFLAGAIDGDGTYNNGRVNIYVSKENLLQAVMIACLRLGIVPQVTKNRTINNVQIVEKLDEISKYTKRVKCKDTRAIGTRFFDSKQLFDKNIFSTSDINNRNSKNLLIDEKNILKKLELIKDKKLKQSISKLLNSDIRQLRVNKTKEFAVKDVYNITVDKNHNYIVFTSKYTPVLVNNCHAAIISRELGIPCIVGTIDATNKLSTGDLITIDCTLGDSGYVYKGKLRYKIDETNLKTIPKTKTKIMLNVGDPEQAFEFSFLPNDGVGLAREEFIINSWIKIHPLALVNYNKITDKDIKKEIDEITFGYSDKEEFFVDKLSQGIARIAAAFYPKKVILRLSDFKSDEYANLIGGKLYEPIESNPMIGWRGASRYYQGNYREGFRLECLAVRRVRDEFGLKNLEIMIPFCRTITEAKKVMEELAKNGLKKGIDGLNVVCMCEIPSNVILAEEFLKIFDGFSIGSNDLTQLTLGLDRNSEIIASIYDERNDAVKDLVRKVIKVAKSRGKYIGICGQAPSDYPDFAEFLVEEGIESISLNPDTVIKTTIDIAKTEKEIEKKRKK
ncbi:MAG: putative PEP-binding protein [archaeon]